MNKTMFCLLALGLMATSFARPSDYDLFVRSGATLRYLGPEQVAPYWVFPKGNFEDYQDVGEYLNVIRMTFHEVIRDCPKENGVPICV